MFQMKHAGIHHCKLWMLIIFSSLPIFSEKKNSADEYAGFPTANCVAEVVVPELSL